MTEELEVDKLIIHHWKKQTNIEPTFNCDYWDCSHKINTNEIFYTELYPEGHDLSFCLECSAFFMSQALNTLMEVTNERHTD